VRRLLLLPLTDVLNGLDRCLIGRAGRGLALVLLGLAVGWWVYVPVHELLHAAACSAAGGEVHRLEIGLPYGGALLARIFPFVVAGSRYAGRLSGFDTHGSDWIYLAADLGPFLLTLFPGVWLLRRSAAAPWPFLFGASLPLALAPFLSLTGDAYEIGSIVVTRLPCWREMAERVRGDDLLALPAGAPWETVAAAALVGLTWAWLTWKAGDRVARGLGRAPVAPLPAPLPED
jgi:hypothetical protein